MKSNLFRSLQISALLLSVCVSAFAQEPADKPIRPAIRVTGESTITAKPDQALISIGVVTQSPNADQAASQNASRLDGVLSSIKKLLGPEAEIKTSGYSLTPIRVYPKEGGEPKITGYQASNILRVKTVDLAKIGAIIDAATQAGANDIQSLQFMLKDEQSVKLTALREATASAKAQAEAIASALGVQIGGVLLAEEGGGTVRPYYSDESAMLQANVKTSVPTSIEPGAIEIRATVTLTVRISQ